MSDTPKLSDLCDEVTNRRAVEYRRRENTYPQHVPRASNITSCDREMVFQLTHWQHKPPFHAELLQRFQRGRVIESAVVRELSEIGMEVTEAQMSCEVRDRDSTLLATAHTDGRLSWRDLTPVFECKSLNPMVWARIDTVSDFNRVEWSKRYPRQLLLYMYACSEPHGVMLLDDCLGHWKVLPFFLEHHLGECERILTRLRRVVDAEASGEELPCIDNPLVCRDCWCFKTGICTPAMDFSQCGIHTIWDEELEGHFSVVAATSEQAKDHAAADTAIKEHFKARGEGQYMVGKWLVKTKVGKTQTRTTWEELD